MKSNEQNNRNILKVVESLIANGFQITYVDRIVEHVKAVGNDGEEVSVSIGGAGYCYVKVDDFVCTNMAQPFNVGEAARLRRHVGMFE